MTLQEAAGGPQGVQEPANGASGRPGCRESRRGACSAARGGGGVTDGLDLDDGLNYVIKPKEQQ